jgi:hypothetical protein
MKFYQAEKRPRKPRVVDSSLDVQNIDNPKALWAVVQPLMFAAATPVDAQRRVPSF